MNISLKQFNGPLNLLLELIEKEKLDISTISLSKITEQYLNTVSNTANVSFCSLISFLEIASRLIILKTRVLLPYLEPNDAKEEQEDLILQLKRYKQYTDIAQTIDKAYHKNTRSFSRKYWPLVKKHTKLKNINTHAMEKLMQNILKKTNKDRFPAHKFKKMLKLRTKIKNVSDYLKKNKCCIFSELITQNATKINVIVSLLAILELNKRQRIYIKQKNIFEDILINI